MNASEAVAKFVGRTICFHSQDGWRIEAEAVEVRQTWGRIDILARQKVAGHVFKEAWIDSARVTQIRDI